MVFMFANKLLLIILSDEINNIYYCITLQRNFVFNYFNIR